MTIVHIANTDVEIELATNFGGSLEKAWERYPIFLQLQFLPLLYAEPNEVIAVTALPEASYLDAFANLKWRQGAPLPTIALLSEVDPFLKGECVAWGPSKRVAAWANTRKMTCNMPSDWSMIQRVNSKAYSFEYSTLKESALVWNVSDLERWLKLFSGKKVLKTCFGLSGKGHCCADDTTSLRDISPFCEKEWKQGRPLVAELWLDRLFDFSTQWVLDKEGHAHLEGSTVFETNLHGIYQGTLVGPESSIFGDYQDHLAEHKKIVLKMLQDLSKQGFYGHVGVDALVYHCKKSEKPHLYPIVEINARKTMSWAALRMQQKWFPDQTIRLMFRHYTHDRLSLLPPQLSGMAPFTHQLSLN